MDLYISIFIFILGLVIGSFLNVCIYRIPMGESVAFPPSHCTKCNNRLTAMDLIPVLSYMFLKGKCRHCGERIKSTYAIVELITAISFLSIYSKYGIGVEFATYSFLISVLIVMAKIDLEHLEVYLSVSIVGALGGISMSLYNLYMGESILRLVLSIALPLIIIGIVILLTKGMGTGDLEGYVMVAIYFPVKITAFIIGLSIVIGGIHGLVRIVLGKAKRKEKMAFIPYIAVATFIAIIWGQTIINSYLQLIGLS